MLNIRRLSVRILGSLLALFLLLIVVNFGPNWADDPGANVVNADPKNIDVVDVTDHFPTGIIINAGGSQLLRTKDGIAFQLNTVGLVPGTGYTLWMFIDENDDTSLPAPSPRLSQYEIRIQMGGSFAAPDGSGQFSGFLPTGALPAVNGLDVLAIDDGSFDDPQKADVNLIVRWHGAAVPGLEYEQTHFIFGGPVTNMSVQEALHIGDHSQSHRNN